MGIGGGIGALEVTVQHHLLLTFRGKGIMPMISHRRSRFLILSLPNEHKFLSNTLILLGFREYFLKFYPLLILYLSSTKPLPILYQNSTYLLHSIYCRSMFYAAISVPYCAIRVPYMMIRVPYLGHCTL